ncbi:MAG: arylsulfatase [Verrucomicrobiales bacterium]|nr:arylsulfatase [Verrucomicrobiales bacterium]
MKKTLLLSLVFGLGASLSVAEPQKPNVIVIMADDLGYGDLSCYGTKSFETPYIDQLANEGVRFTSGYCSASTCTPTRWSFLTGTYAFREKNTGIAAPSSPFRVNHETTCIADMFKTAGYSTAVIGKWHLGLGGEEGPDWNGELKPGPLEIGFDTCFLLPTTNDRVPQVYVKDHRVLNLDPSDPLWVGSKAPSPEHPTGINQRETLKMDWTHGHNATIHNGISRIGFYTGGHKARFRDEDLADKWVEQSVEFIDENKDGPFFLFFASHDLHVPRIPHERFQGATDLGYRADAIVQLDWCVGELMKALDDRGIAENTMIVFCSDNGPVMDDGYADEALEKLGDHKAGGGFTGGKYSVYEGGTRTPFITRWKGAIEPGVSDEVVCTIDLYASLASLTGTALEDDAARDSMDVMGALLGKAGAKGRNELVQQDNGARGNFGFRQGDWKLQVHAQGKARNVVVEKLLETTAVAKIQLFNLAEDPVEKNDLAESNVKKAEEMKARLDKIIADGRSR